MKKHQLVFLSLIAGTSLNAQEVISTQGNSYSNASGSIDYTIGEVVIDTGTDGTTDITQGFHQTNWNFVGLDDHLPSYQASVFPNPIQDVLNIEVSVYDGVSYILYDELGRIVMQNQLESGQTILAVSDLTMGSYSLVLIGESNNILKTFKLVKHL